MEKQKNWNYTLISAIVAIGMWAGSQEVGASYRSTEIKELKTEIKEIKRDALNQLEKNNERLNYFAIRIALLGGSANSNDRQ